MSGLWNRLRALAVPPEERPGRSAPAARRARGGRCVCGVRGVAGGPAARGSLARRSSRRRPRPRDGANVLNLVFHAARWAAVVRHPGMSAPPARRFRRDGRRVRGRDCGPRPRRRPRRLAPPRAARAASRRPPSSARPRSTTSSGPRPSSRSSSLPASRPRSRTGRATRSSSPRSGRSRHRAGVPAPPRPRRPRSSRGGGAAGLLAGCGAGWPRCTSRSRCALLGWGLAGWGAGARRRVVHALAGRARADRSRSPRSWWSPPRPRTPSRVPRQRRALRARRDAPARGLGVAREPALAFALLSMSCTSRPPPRSARWVLVREAGAAPELTRFARRPPPAAPALRAGEKRVERGLNRPGGYR